MIAKKYTKLLLGGICITLSSCAFLIDSMIYSNKTQTCALVNSWGDTVSVYTECGGYYDRASEDCDEDASAWNGGYEPHEYEYNCCCSTTKDDD